MWKRSTELCACALPPVPVRACGWVRGSTTAPACVLHRRKEGRWGPRTSPVRLETRVKRRTEQRKAAQEEGKEAAGQEGREGKERKGRAGDE
jgi:hypothetical protein